MNPNLKKSLRSNDECNYRNMQINDIKFIQFKTESKFIIKTNNHRNSRLNNKIDSSI